MAKDNFFDFFRNLKEKIFGKEHPIPGAKTSVSYGIEKRSEESGISDKVTTVNDLTEKTKKTVETKTRPVSRLPYFIQIGFDFGTSFSKCVYRDIITERAYVYIPKTITNHELPFLIPSVLIYKDKVISTFNGNNYHYPENGLYHLKSALIDIYFGHWNSPVLDCFKSVGKFSETDELRRFVENCTVYYLACTLGEIKNSIKGKYAGFGTNNQDYLAVNMAIPVAEAQRIDINNRFHHILTEAWILSDKIAGCASLDFDVIEDLRRELNIDFKAAQDSPCFIYPEVSANVQGFVRSRVSGGGIYLFSDVGASTVDQSVFIFSRHDGNESLTYLHGSVLPLGSSQIEYLAAKAAGNTDRKSLEKWRKHKEERNYRPELSIACNKIKQELDRGTEKTLAHAKMKLVVKEQLRGIRLIFGGGGNCENPYRNGVSIPFTGHLFAQAVNPDIISLPPPHDLELKETETRWIRRLSVAYGLSFEKSELVRFIYPKDVPTPSPEEIWRSRSQIPEAPSKDQC